MGPKWAILGLEWGEIKNRVALIGDLFRNISQRFFAAKADFHGLSGVKALQRELCANECHRTDLSGDVEKEIHPLTRRVFVSTAHLIALPLLLLPTISGEPRIQTPGNIPMTDKPSPADVLELTKEVVAAHVGNNRVPLADLPQLINDVYRTLSSIGGEANEPERPRPAVSPKRSVYPDYLVCLEDGKKLKMLKRHLKTAYNMTPEEYRERWNLPPDYPMVAPNYAQHRSELARQIGLGRRRGADDGSEREDRGRGAGMAVVAETGGVGDDDGGAVARQQE